MLALFIYQDLLDLPDLPSALQRSTGSKDLRWDPVRPFWVIPSDGMPEPYRMTSFEFRRG